CFTRCFSGGHRDGCGENRMNRSRRIKLQVFRSAVFLAMGVFFLVPIAAMFEFSTRGNSVTAPRTMEAWTNIIKTPDLVDAIIASLELAAITSIAMLVLLLPTMVWVRLRLPRLNRIVEFICLLSVAVVLGEYTFANLLTYENLQVAIAYVGLVSAGTSIAVAVASLLFAFVLLMVLSFVGRPRERMARAEETIVAPESRILPLRDSYIGVQK